MSFSRTRWSRPFVLAATVAAALLFGVLPAWQVTKTDVGATSQGAGRGAIGSRGQLRSGRAAGQPATGACPCRLLVGAGLLARTAYNLQRVGSRLPAERLLLVRVDLRDAVYDPARRDSMLSRADPRTDSADPGRDARRASRNSACSAAATRLDDDRSGRPRADRRQRPRIGLDAVGPGYFSTLGRAASRWDATSWRAIAPTRRGSA